MAQTSDGWLWLGTPTGLYRFDGVRFHPFAAADGERLLSKRISSLKADAAGDLYIGYADVGLTVLHADGRLEHLAPADKSSPVGSAHAMLRDDDGTLWVGTSSGLLHLEQGRWNRIGPAQGYPEEVTYVLALDADRQLWAASLKWPARLAGRRDATFIDQGQMVAVVRSARFLIAAVAAVPVAQGEARTRALVYRLVPAGALAGLAVAVALLSLVRRQRSIASALRHGLRRNEFHLQYQPILGSGAGRRLRSVQLSRCRPPILRARGRALRQSRCCCRPGPSPSVS